MMVYNILQLLLLVVALIPIVSAKCYRNGLCTSSSSSSSSASSSSSSDDDEADTASFVELSAANFYEEMVQVQVESPVFVFVKFYDSMCGHCLLMAEDWERLAADYYSYSHSSSILFGNVECTQDKATKALCQQLGIKGYPTLLYGDVTDLQTYTGGRSYREMKEFVDHYIIALGTSNSGPTSTTTHFCGIHNDNNYYYYHNCPPDKQQQIQQFKAMSLRDLDNAIQKMEQQWTQTETDYQRLVLTLREQHNQARKDKDTTVSKAQQTIQIMRSVQKWRKNHRHRP